MEPRLGSDLEQGLSAVVVLDSLPAGSKDLPAAVEHVADEMERELTSESQYWERLQEEESFDWTSSGDIYDALAEEYELNTMSKRTRKNHTHKKTAGSALPLYDATEEYPQGPASNLPNQADQFDPKLIVGIVRTLDSRYELAAASGRFKQLAAVAISPQDAAALVAGYDHMMATLFLPRFRSRYHNPSATPSSLHYRDPVPMYYANTGGESMHRRKELSIAGLRNLIHCGPSIYGALARTHFSYVEAAAANGPLTTMRHQTGNVVDLDTVVLRCSSTATLNAINMSNRHKGLPVFQSQAAFGDSDQAKEIAIHCAAQAIAAFQDTMKLTDAQMRARRSAVADMPAISAIPTAHDNASRGHTPLWRYVNCGQDSYHANVPHLEDVSGALLRAPLHCVYHYAYLFSGVFGPWQRGQAVEGTDKLPAALLAKLDAFFEDCVQDSCFNMKWKAIEEFGEMLRHEGTIRFVLETLQMRHQAAFPASLFDADDELRTAEIAATWECLLKEGGLSGRDEETGKVRPITRGDVEKWVRST